jgi:hypothetical protein
VNPDGTVQANRTLNSMGCQRSYKPVNEPNYNTTPAPATYDWTCSLAVAGADISVTATRQRGGADRHTGRPDRDGHLLRRRHCDVPVGAPSYGIATSHEIQPGHTWSVFVAVPVVNDSHFQTVSCQVVSR